MNQATFFAENVLFAVCIAHMRLKISFHKFSAKRDAMALRHFCYLKVTRFASILGELWVLRLG